MLPLIVAIGIALLWGPILGLVFFLGALFENLLDLKRHRE